MSSQEETKPNDWYLAYTKPRQEEIARVNLEQQSFEAYLPLYKKFKKTELGPVSVFEPMFPRYIFFPAGQSRAKHFGRPKHQRHHHHRAFWF